MGQSSRLQWVRSLSLLNLIVLALAVALPLLLCVDCAVNRPLYVYRAYQEPSSARGPDYLREALVVAPNHAVAMEIVARTMAEVHRDWSGPIYISLLGVCEEKRRPGLLGGPVWLETAGAAREKQAGAAAAQKKKTRESLRGSPSGSKLPAGLP